MKINFLLPCYRWGPSGGFNIVYEYASRLAAHGHEVNVIHPRLLKFPPPEKLTPRRVARKLTTFLRESVHEPSIYWYRVDPRVRLRYVPNSGQRHIPDADVLFATAWHTVRSVLECPPEKGEKCYLIQAYETFQGPKELVDATWLAPLHKVVSSKYLADIADQLGARDVHYVPSAVEHDIFRLSAPIRNRHRHVTFMASYVPLKRTQDAVVALQDAKRQFPDLKVTAFGIDRRPPCLSPWMDYRQNPSRQALVDILNQSSIVLSSSESEGFGLPPAEGAACGCAMVSTDSGGVREFIIHGETGLLSPPREPQALAKNLCLLLGHDHLRIRLAEAGRNLVSRFTWERSTQLILSFLNSVIAKKQPSRDTFPVSLYPHHRVPSFTELPHEN